MVFDTDSRYHVTWLTLISPLLCMLQTPLVWYNIAWNFMPVNQPSDHSRSWVSTAIGKIYILSIYLFLVEQICGFLN